MPPEHAHAPIPVPRLDHGDGKPARLEQCMYTVTPDEQYGNLRIFIISATLYTFLSSLPTRAVYDAL